MLSPLTPICPCPGPTGQVLWPQTHSAGATAMLVNGRQSWGRGQSWGGSRAGRVGHGRAELGAELGAGTELGWGQSWGWGQGRVGEALSVMNRRPVCSDTPARAACPPAYRLDAELADGVVHQHHAVLHAHADVSVGPAALVRPVLKALLLQGLEATGLWAPSPAPRV